MKKLLFCTAILVSFNFCGCKFFSNLFGINGEEEKDIVETTVPVSSTGTVYLVKLNNSNKIVKAKNTGYVSGVTGRAATNNEEKPNMQYYDDPDSFIRNLNNKIINSVSGSFSSSRAASGESSVASGYSTKNYGSTEKFWSYTGTKTKSSLLGSEEINIATKLDTQLKYNGTHCLVYADKNNSTSKSKGIDLKDEDYTHLGEKFDSCYELETGVLGNPLYEKYNSDLFVPCNKKIIILVSDLFGDAQDVESPSGTVGYFYSADLFKQAMLDETAGINKGKTSSDDEYIHSNECEIFYIDSLFLTKMPATVYSTLVHEFNHMINYVVKTLNYMTTNTSVNTLRACDTWFTEMLSMTTEDMFQSYLGISDQDSPKARLTYFGMSYYYGFKNWDDKTVDPLVFYANTYAFGAFLARNFGGIEFVKQVAQNNYINEKAITNALQTIYPDQTYTDELTKEEKKLDFTYALRKFTMCIINTKSGDSWSLNRPTTFENGLGFSAVDIKTKITYQGRKINVPFTFLPGEDGMIDIYPTGFTVHKVGKNISSFTLASKNDQYLEYHVIQ